MKPFIDFFASHWARKAVMRAKRSDKKEIVSIVEK